MFQYYIVLFGVCTNVFQNVGSMRVYKFVGNEEIESPIEMAISSDGGSDDLQIIIHIIGSTHGDNNYLLRCLQSTDRVEVVSSGERHTVRWAPGMSEDEYWEVVVLGDIIDMSIRSREHLLILKSLSEDPRWGDRLVVLLGDHESMLLEGFPDGADGEGHWSYVKRMQDLCAREGTEGHSLIRWLTLRPVVYFSHGLLLMHGGLSKRHADKLAEEIGCQQYCWQAMQDVINGMAKNYYIGLHQFYLSGSQNISEWSSVSTAPDILSDDSKDTARGPGVLWYKGWSEEYEAGDESVCREAEQVGAYLFSHPVIVGSHTTHPRIVQFCGTFGVPIFAVDTHPLDCSDKVPAECDFDFRRDNETEYEENDYDKTHHLPQSLKMTLRSRTREFAACYERKHEAYCKVLRSEIFDDIGMSQSDLFDASNQSDLSDPSELFDPFHPEQNQKREVGQSPLRKSRRSEVATLTESMGLWHPWGALEDLVPTVAGGGSIGVHASLRVKPGRGREFEAVFEEMAEGVRAHEPGVTCYQLVRSQTDECAYEVVEIYSGLDALERHANQPYILDGRQRMNAFIAAEPEAKTFSVGKRAVEISFALG